MAPIRAPKIIGSEMAAAETIPRPMVLATCWPNTRNATKLKNAAQATALRGDRTRVETIVAMELAASLRPLRKSKASAMAIRTESSSMLCSSVLDADSADAVRQVPEAIHHFFEVTINV